MLVADKVNFKFVVVGHAKNAADCTFNCLKTKYQKQNHFIFNDLVEILSRLAMVTVHPATPEDFFNYDKLLSTLF